ncbi:MFS transporter [Rhodococcus sp. F64268]|uniref:MFS transporter n=1 Tax=Rhodococcus sp. F64268 TaxID=2926402 RepID=UPI001FF6E9C4|nr:MFS transporter [Rhodococcus sp. F64268]MCK0089673.1 MFS transporter [Rhodococcus sp. F64268]
MTAAAPAAPTGTAAGPSPVKGWLAVLAVTLGIFSLMTSELLPVGLLTPVGDALDVSEGRAGLMVTIPGLVAALSAPLITVAAGRMDRRLVLALLIGMMGAANLASAFATDFAVVLAARFLIGISVGGFWALAGGIALRLVPQRHVVRATAVIFSGVEAASVLGVPAGTFLGGLSSWRTAFGAVGVLGLVALTAMLFLVPRLPPQRTLGLTDLPAVFRNNAGVRVGIMMTVLIITGHFTAYTFLRPVLQGSGVDGGSIGMLLLAFGVAGLCGNFIAGALVDRWLPQTALGISLVLTVAMVAVAVTDTTVVSAAGMLALWGLGYGAVPVTLQTWMFRSAPDAVEAASSLFVSAFNLSIAAGALIGGLVVDALSPTSVLWIGGVLTALTVLVIGTSVRAGRRTPSAPEQ